MESMAEFFPCSLLSMNIAKALVHNGGFIDMLLETSFVPPLPDAKRDHD